MPVDSSYIVCIAQQSRFHVDTLLTSYEIDLRDVSISIGENDLLVDSHIRIKEGVRYALVGRNGTGKTTLLTALADKLIPGLNSKMRIVLLSQVEESTKAADQAATGQDSVLTHVIASDKERLELIRKQTMLTKAVEASSILVTQKIVNEIELEQRQEDLRQAQLLAKRRSGARGKAARKDEISAEGNLQLAEQKLRELTMTSVDTSCMDKATQMLLDIQLELNLIDSESIEARASTILSGLGFTEDMVKSPYLSLSGGWRSRCSLATSLLVHSDVLCLDEPSNFLDLESLLWLESFLVSSDKTLVVTSHDQAFLNAVAEETMIIRDQKITYFEGNPTAHEVISEKERRKQMTQKAALDKKREHIESSIKAGKAAAKKSGDDNALRMAKIRQTKLDERFGLEKSAKGGRFKLNRDAGNYGLTKRADIVVDKREADAKVSLPNPEGLRTVGNLVHLEKVTFKRKSASKPLLSEISLTIGQKDRCALLGANGQGKSTIAKLIMGELKPSSGTVGIHPTARIGYFSQHSVEDLSEAKNVNETALSYIIKHCSTSGEKMTEQQARALLGSFGLKGSITSDAPLSYLSGGQKVRVALALIFYRPPALLLLDEVSTHLDASTMKALAEALRSYQGAILLITHDRWMSQMVIENTSYRTLQLEEAAVDLVDSSEDEDTGSESEDDPSQLRCTFRIGAGKLRPISGMQEYIQWVEKKRAKRKKALA